MKAIYQKPEIIFEDFALNTSIASGCVTVVSLGPGDLDHPLVCDEYKVQISSYSNRENPQPVNFYENSCTCFLSAGVGSLFTS